MAVAAVASGARIHRARARAFTIPTETPESDGTFDWTRTTLVIAEVTAENKTGIGLSYADDATAAFIDHHLRDQIVDLDPFDVPLAWEKMRHAVRNLGRPGVASMAISAVDNALWDLKARLLERPLCKLLGGARESVPAYASGGFTNYTDAKLQEHLGSYRAEGHTRFKIKVGRDPHRDADRVRLARATIGSAELFVDGNGAYTMRQALAAASVFSDAGAIWFEEPVSSDDLAGLHGVRARAPNGMDVTAGEYGYDLVYFERMLQSEAVDVLQVDATRCGGISEFRRVAALAAARNLPISAHTAPTQHLHVALSVPNLRHVEFFHDHVRIERRFLDGAARAENGNLIPDLTRAGNGLVIREADIAPFQTYGGRA